MSTLKTDAIEAATGTNTDLSLDGKGSGVPDLGAGFKVGGSAGVPTASIQDDAITLAKMASGTDGVIISYDASGNPVHIGPGSDGEVLTSTGAGSPPAFEAVAAGGPTLGTMQTPTGTLAAFSGIPAGTKRITINMSGISLDATASSYLRLRLGDAGGIELGGYLGRVAEVDATDTRTEAHYNDFELDVYNAQTDLLYGTVILTLINAATFQWACSFVLGRDPGNAVSSGGGSKTLSAELTQLDLGSGSGSGNFDAVITPDFV